MRRSVCVISFSPVARDGRVLRQLEYLLPHYDLTAIGLGPAPVLAAPSTRFVWRQLPEGAEPSGWQRRLSDRVASRLVRSAIPALNLLHAPGWLRHAAHERWYWSGLWPRAAWAFAVEAKCDAYHANDWTALPIAAEAARHHGARLIFDAHEYAPLELENRPLWRLRHRPVILHFLGRYAPQVDAFTTVCEPIGRRYQEEFRLRPTIVYNTPKRLEVPRRRIDPESIRLIHHGAPFRDRRLDKLIVALAACDPRFSLHFALVPGHAGYAQELEGLGRRIAPGRVFFHPPAAPEETARMVSQYDMGFCVIEPSNYNYRMAAPNKFFDYVAAELPVCIGPSPAMAAIVQAYGLGCVAPSFEPRAVAATLNALDGPRLAEMQAGARRAAAVFHADAEMAKLVALYRALLPEVSGANPAGGRAGGSVPESRPSAAPADRG